MPVPPRDLYAVLGVPPSATTEEIERAWRRLVVDHHPDHATDEQDRLRRTEATVALNGARAVLRDPAQRTAYDLARRRVREHRAGAAEDPFTDARARYRQQRPATGDPGAGGTWTRWNAGCEHCGLDHADGPCVPSPAAGGPRRGRAAYVAPEATASRRRRLLSWVLHDRIGQWAITLAVVGGLLALLLRLNPDADPMTYGLALFVGWGFALALIDGDLSNPLGDGIRAVTAVARLIESIVLVILERAP